MIVVDTSCVIALLNRRDAHHAATKRWYARTRELLVTTPLVVAEVDHLAMARGGTAATGAWRADLRDGVYRVEWWDSAPVDCVVVADQYDQLGVGLTDASLVVLAKRLDTNRIATHDQRHFRAMTPLTNHDAFVLLPSDA